MSAPMTPGLQTARPVEALGLAITARPAEWLSYVAGEMDLNPPYQRGHVWGPRRQRMLIRSMLMGLPIGALVLNDRGEGSEWAVIDGKQRLTAITAWLEGGLSVPVSWFPAEDTAAAEDWPFGQYVRIHDLSDRRRRLFAARPVAMVEARVAGIQAEEEIFNLINFGGVPL